MIKYFRCLDFIVGILFDGETLEAFPQRSLSRQVCPFLHYYPTIVLEVFDFSGTSIRKEESKLPWFAHDMIWWYTGKASIWKENQW